MVEMAISRKSVLKTANNWEKKLSIIMGIFWLLTIVIMGIFWLLTIVLFESYWQLIPFLLWFYCVGKLFIFKKEDVLDG